MKKFFAICIGLICCLTSCMHGEGGGDATPHNYEGRYTTYEIDGFGGAIVDTRHSGTTKVKVEIPDLLAGKLDFTFLGVKFVAMMPELVIKVPSLAYAVEQGEAGVTYRVDVAEAVPMIGSVERDDYKMRNIKASIGATTTFEFELQKRDKVYRVVFSTI